jgi:glutamine synthetase
LCDDYFSSGQPFYFSPRHLLRKQLQRLRERSLRLVVGLEVEWYLLRLSEERLADEHVGAAGIKGRALRTHPVEAGYSLHSETGLDLMHGPLSELARAYQKLDLPVRSFENEWGPGQVECTFAPAEALQAADNMLLFRTATRQLCRRMGYLASFMCRPKLKGAYPSGWHLHQSVVETGGGANIFTPSNPGESLSPVGKAYLGGLLQHALAAAVLANPTVNAYRRFRANSLAPDRLAWGIDHRGVLLRVLSEVGGPATRIENRIGEPAANPYLYMTSQILAGLDGVDRGLDPGPSADTPYETKAALLPKSLQEAVSALKDDPFFRAALGAEFVDYYVHIKNAEIERFQAEVSDWEQREYFEMF